MGCLSMGVLGILPLRSPLGRTWVSLGTSSWYLSWVHGGQPTSPSNAHLGVTLGDVPSPHKGVPLLGVSNPQAGSLEGGP